MAKAYLFLYDQRVGTRQHVQSVIERMNDVLTWRYDLPNCFYVVSNSSAQELYESFIKLNGNKGRFMFIEAGANRQGMMPSKTWYLLTNKKIKPKD